MRLSLRHPGVKLTAVSSRQNAGSSIASVFPKFAGHPGSELKFTDSSTVAIVDSGAEFVFLALPHGVAAEFAKRLVEAGLRVIDLSADFRIKDAAVYADYYGAPQHSPELAAISVYGMPEVYRRDIRNAQLVACPGCYPTSIVLPLHPLLRRGLIEPSTITISSVSGVSGAGRSLKTDYLFTECNESVRAYGVPKHRHLAEIEQELSAAAGQKVTVSFTPHLMPVTRGIHTTIYASIARNASGPQVLQALREAYARELFVRVLEGDALPDTKHVTGTNFVDIACRFDPRTGRVVLLSAVDNLIKGASGQAMQCLNLMCDMPEEAGLL